MPSILLEHESASFRRCDLREVVCLQAAKAGVSTSASFLRSVSIR